MSTMTEQEFLLSKVLEDHEMSSVPCKYNPTLMTIHDCDGDEIIRVTKTINHHDLRAFLVQRHAVWARGVSAGKIALQHELRKLIGAKGEDDAN